MSGAQNNILVENKVDRHPQVHSNGLTDISFSSCSRFCVTVSFEQFFVIWAAQSDGKWRWEKIEARKEVKSNVNTCAFHPYLCEGRLFALGTARGGVHFWTVHIRGGSSPGDDEVVLEIDAEKQKTVFNGKSNSYPRTIVFTPCGTRMVVGLYDGSLIIFRIDVQYGVAGDGDGGSWEVSQIAKLDEAVTKTKGLHRVSISSSMWVASVCGWASNVDIWKENGQGKEVVVSLGLEQPARRVALASSSLSYPFRLQPACSYHLGEEGLGGNPSPSCGWQDWIAVGGQEGSLKVWQFDPHLDRPTFVQVQCNNEKCGGDVCGLSFAFAQNGMRVILASADIGGSICVWMCDRSANADSTSVTPFTLVQHIETGMQLTNCSFSRCGRTFAVTQIFGDKDTNGSDCSDGVYFWPCIDLLPAPALSQSVWGPVSPREMANMQKAVAEHVVKMKEEMAEVEKRMEDQHDDQQSLIFLQKLAAEKSKVALPHILRMSDQLQFDLLHLSSDELHAFFPSMGDLEFLKGMCEEVRSLLYQYRLAISKTVEDEESVIKRKPASVKSILSGEAPPALDGGGLHVPVYDCALHFCTKLPESKCSEWHASVRRDWAWLKTTGAWREVEEKVERALETNENSHVLCKLRSKMSEIGLVNPALLARLKERIMELLPIEED